MDKKIAMTWENVRFLWPQLLCPTIYQRNISVEQPEASTGSLATQPFLSLVFSLTNNLGWGEKQKIKKKNPQLMLYLLYL